MRTLALNQAPHYDINNYMYVYLCVSCISGLL